MAYRLTYTATCDHCRATLPGLPGTTKAAIWSARAAGWRRVSLASIPVDLCPACERLADDVRAIRAHTRAIERANLMAIVR